MPGWNYAQVLEVVADVQPTARAQVHGQSVTTWKELDGRADAVATCLLEHGLGHQAKVAQYLYNSPEYLESVVASFKAGLVPVNTNYRYVDQELVDLWTDADAEAVVFHGSFVDRLTDLRERLRGVRVWLWVDDGTAACPDWALDYDAIARCNVPRARPSWGRRQDDLILIYTGGTTGRPKGVMWRQADIFDLLNRSAPQPYPAAPDAEAVRRTLEVSGPGGTLLPGAPLMHGTGLCAALLFLQTGGSVVTLTGRRFDPVETFDAIERNGVNGLVIVGDAFARPLVDALDESPERWDLSSLDRVLSSGVMWSAPVKQALLAHLPDLTLIDSLGSTEAVGIASSVSTGGGTVGTATFSAGPSTRILTDEEVLLPIGTAGEGHLVVGGAVPLGYYKDPEKSAATFRVLDGDRYAVPGDYARVDVDGTITLIGRGSMCINTGGEKVFVEEVEEVLKLHPSVDDAAVVGVPDARFGHSVVAVVEAAGVAQIDEAELIAHARSHLASYKAPKRVVVVTALARAANGKLDYGMLLRVAEASVH